jgi:hypothetical protein
MGALHYYLRIFLLKKNVEYKIIAPGALKKFVTGTGTAKKELVLLNVYKKPMPNRYLADFTKFLSEHLDHPFVIDLVKSSFQDFLDIPLSDTPHISRIILMSVSKLSTRPIKSMLL